MSRKIQLAVKRALDVVVSLIALLVLTPLLILIAVILRLDSRGPAVFKLNVAGKDGKSFRQWKFRTMRVDARRSGHQYEISADDPRITRVGRILRRWSLDELPQLWNILRGEMSLVGPRPTFVEVAGQYSSHEAQRLAMRPGLTGWAQVNGRNLLPWSTRVQYDVDYIRGFSLWLDLMILLRTIPVVIRKRGVYGPDGSVRMHYPA